MFEKEAEDSFNCKKVLYKWETDKRSYIDGFKDGCNKANEWHFVKDGDLPKKENLEYLCIDKVWTGQTFTTILKCCDGVFIDSNGTPYNVIAWKEIVLPKESE